MKEKPKSILALRIFSVLTILLGILALVPGVLSPLFVVAGMRIPTVFLALVVLLLGAQGWRRTNRLEKELMKS